MTIEPIIAQFGSWKSPISAAALGAQAMNISEPRFDGNCIYWLESRPNENGRNALMQRMPTGECKNLLASPSSVRTRANEYGGGSYTVSEGLAYLVLDADQRIYRLDINSDQCEAISPQGNYRYADLCIDPQRQRLICVREDHTRGVKEPRCEIIAIALDGSYAINILVSGADFYSNPTVSPNAAQLSWLCWNHPQMPWDGSECYIAQFNDEGLVDSSLKVAGGNNESIFQPRWSPAGDLFFVSDKNQWWNLYRWRSANAHTEIVCEMEADFATPQWVFGLSTYDFLDANTVFCCYSQHGQWNLVRIDLTCNKIFPITCDFTDVSAIACRDNFGLFLGAAPALGNALYHYDCRRQTIEPVTKSSKTLPPVEYLSPPQAISFNTRDEEIAHGFYYSPCNPDYRAPAETKPPLLVMCHGGPTGATQSSLNMKVQYWTSRGFAVLDINYRGSSGYGRQYRDRLKNNWGVTDVIDVCSGADYVIDQGWVDADKIALRGSSAGGYTVLAALTFSTRFNAGTSLYGIGNLETLAQDTHKFESRYLDSLVGKYPEEKHIYASRSPINHVDQLNCPVIFFQGLLDKVVPPNQAQAMVDALTHKGIANAYVTFPNEGHGFRQAENIARAFDAELFFYSRVFGFDPAENIEPVTITHLKGFSV